MGRGEASQQRCAPPGVNPRSLPAATLDQDRRLLEATIDDVAARTERALLAAYVGRRERSPEERFRDAFLTLVDLAGNEPAAFKLWLVDGVGAGPDALARADSLRALLERLASAAFEGRRHEPAMPSELVKAIVGGLHLVIHARLRADRADELAELAPDLLAWALSYRPPNGRLMPRRMPDPDPVPSPSPRPSRPDDAVDALVGDRERRLLETTADAHRGGTHWPNAIGTGFYTFFASLAGDARGARLGDLATRSGGTAALSLCETLTASCETLLAGGYRLSPWTPPIASEAIGASVAAAFHEYVQEGRADRLYELAPVATFLALAPFVSNAQATAIATESSPSASPR